MSSSESLVETFGEVSINVSDSWSEDKESKRRGVLNPLSSFPTADDDNPSKSITTSNEAVIPSSTEFTPVIHHSRLSDYDDFTNKVSTFTTCHRLLSAANDMHGTPLPTSYDVEQAIAQQVLDPIAYGLYLFISGHPDTPILQHRNDVERGVYHVPTVAVLPERLADQNTLHSALTYIPLEKNAVVKMIKEAVHELLRRDLVTTDCTILGRLGLKDIENLGEFLETTTPTTPTVEHRTNPATSNLLSHLIDSFIEDLLENKTVEMGDPDEPEKYEFNAGGGTMPSILSINLSSKILVSLLGHIITFVYSRNVSLPFLLARWT